MSAVEITKLFKDPVCISMNILSSKFTPQKSMRSEIVPIVTAVCEDQRNLIMPTPHAFALGSVCHG